MRFLPTLFGLALSLILMPEGVRAQSTVASLQPRTCKPGETTHLTVTGTNLGAALRAVTSCEGATVEVESAEPERATLALTLPPDAEFGPLGLWIASEAGLAEPWILIVDDLPPVADNGANHTAETAQQVAALAAIDGTSDGAKSDFYRFTATAGQRIAFAVHTQQLQSSMDPVIRLMDAAGNTLRLADDSAVGPDIQFAFEFPQAGEFLLQVSDSRYAAGGAYHLRIGDFPIVKHSFPLAVRRGDSVELRFATADTADAESRQLSVPAESTRKSMIVATRTAGESSSAWVPVRIVDAPQFAEPHGLAPQAPAANGLASSAEATPSTPLAEALMAPAGISGALSAADQRDVYLIRGLKDTLVRFQSHTRSLGCATLLRMQLLNAAGATVAETAVAETDEWGFDYTFPDDGEYRLEVTDLLGRGGPGFGYAISLEPSGAISLALKPDAATAEKFIIDPVNGACALNLQLERFGYEGPVELSLLGAPAGLRILQPLIPAGAKEARVYLAATEGWTPESLAAVKIVARAKDDPAIACTLDSVALHRVKRPHVPFPMPWNDGVLVLGGTTPGEPFYAMEAAAPTKLARPLDVHTAVLTVKRANAEFKAPVNVLGDALPEGWQLAASAEHDTYTTTLTRARGASEPAELPVLTFGEFGGRGRIETTPLPIEWFDPLHVTIAAEKPLVAGAKGALTATVAREGGDPQPVAVKFVGLPAGITAPAECTIPADQTQATFEVEFSAELATSDSLVLAFEASSKFQGQEFSLASHSKPLSIVASPVALEVYPPEIPLHGPKDRRQLVITGVDAKETLRDWTHDVSLTSTHPEIAEVQGSVVVPKSNGETEIVVQLGAHRQTVPVRVTDMQTVGRTAFESDVLVALSKQGCNSGACHGSPSGKGMFRMSLRAFDKQLDELTLIREDFGRRINRMEPEESLLLLKPLMKVSHGGGKQLHTDDEAYAVLRDWIAEGAQADPPGTPRCVRLEIFPKEKRMLHRDAGGQQLSVTAHFSDGSSRDVTRRVAYESSNTSIATVDKHGRITPHGRGESAILVRFLEHIESTEVMFVEDVPNFVWKAPESNNYVDQLVNDKLRQLQYLPAETCSDAEFLRRAYLDVIGIMPTVEETQEFLADTDAEKRSRLVDRLLERDEFAKFWALKWGDYLKMTSKVIGDEGVYKYHRWVEEAFRNNMPYDEFATRLITADGSTLANPPANFYRAATDMNECVETVSQVFLGARLQCAKCHNHPFERWTQDNYYGLGAFFNRVSRRKTQRPGETFVWFAPTGEVTQPRTGQHMKPWLPQTGSIDLPSDADRREAFAEWLIKSDNPHFARIEANRIWSQLFSRGIVDPIDDFRDSNPPSNAPLLDALAQDFVDSGYDRKHLLRVILNSRTYQASYQTNEWNQADTLYFSHQHPRLLSAEQLLDAVNHLTGLSQTLGGLPAGTMATHLPAPDIVKVEFLKTFGQPERTTVCACERADDSNLGMAIELFNGTTIHEKLRDSNNRFRRGIAAGKTVEEVVRELYLAALCRPPSDLELQAALAHCAQSEDKAAAVEDVCWALLNTDEFLFQH